MAVLDKSKITTLGDVARTGVNPITGEYLSSAQRKTAFRQRSVSAAKVFGKGGALVKTSSNIGSGSNIHGLAERISRLEIQVHTIIKGLNAEEELEKKLQKEQKRDASIENERKDKKNQESKNKKKYKILPNYFRRTRRSCYRMLGNSWPNLSHYKKRF